MNKLLYILLPFFLCSCTEVKVEKQPNILIAIADDATWFHWEQYQRNSASFVNTPSFDRVAADGALFTNCYTPNPKCAPSRAVLLTGRSTWQLEEASYHVGIFPNKFNLYPDILEEAGYKVGFTGKGWGPGSWQMGGLKRNPVGDEYNTYQLDTRPSTGIDKSDYVRNFADFLDKRSDDQPFCFWYGAREPHRPYEFASGIKHGKQLDEAVVLPYWPDNDTVRTDLLDYAFEIEWFDKQLGRMLDMLEANGELSNTLVIVTADNGMSFPRCKGNVLDAGVHLPLAMMWADKIKAGRVVSDFISFRDFAPTFLELAGLQADTTMSGHSFKQQLLSDHSGRIDSSRNYSLLGREVYELWDYPVRGIKYENYIYVHNYYPNEEADGPLRDQYNEGYNKGWILQYPTDIQVLKQRTKGNSYFYDLDIGPRQEEELYDVEKDPYCMHNLANLKEFSSVKKLMIETLKAELLKDKDPRILGNGDIFRTYPYTGKGVRPWDIEE